MVSQSGRGFWRSRRRGYWLRRDRTGNGINRDIALTGDFEFEKHTSHRKHFTDRAVYRNHRAIDRGGHFYCGLVGHHFDQTLIFLDPIAELNMPGHDFGFGYAFANIWQTEMVEAHSQYSITRRNALTSRAGPGK